MYSTVSGHGSVAMAQTQVQPRTTALTKSESMAALKALDSSFATLAEYASPAVVLIRSENKAQPSLNGGMAGVVRGGEGSGVIFRPDGYIVTNDHVVGGFDKVTIILKDGREFPGKVTRAEDSDIAVVKIDANNLPTLPFADSKKVRPGEFAMAIGAPYGLDNSVTIGHVSALNRFNAIPDPITGKERLYPELIQTDAAINMGNSGGPLINVDGEVIGINSSIISPPGAGGGGVGLGFAISSNQARLLAETLIEKGKITRSFMGLVPSDMKDYQKSQMHITSGALVTDVPSDKPAAMAGIKVNDVIVRIGDTPVTDQIDLRNAMLKYAPGTTVEVELIRGGQHKTVKVKLTEPPAQPLARSVPQSDGNMPNIPFGGEDTPDIPNLRDFMKQFQGRSGNGNSGSDQGARKFGHAQLGVQIQDIDGSTQKQFHIPSGSKGAVVMSVEPKSVAERIGIKVGDVIQKVGDKDVKTADELRSSMANVQWGDVKRVDYVRWTDRGFERVSSDVEFK